MPRFPVAVFLLLCGCGGTLNSSLAKRDLKLPAGAARIDVAASELVLDGEALGDFTGPQVRMQIADALQEYFGAPGPSAQPARFRVDARSSAGGTAWMWMFPCLVDLIIIGCPVGWYSANASVDLEVGGRRYSGTGVSTRLIGLYYGHNAYGAVGAAIADALRSIAEQMGPKR